MLDWIASIILMKNKNEADNDSDSEFAGRQLQDNNKKGKYLCNGRIMN